MIARLDTADASTLPGLDARYLRFLEALKAEGFEGEITPDYAARTVLATDNSIYQRLPQAVLSPRHGADLERIARLAGREEHREVVLTRAAAAPAPTASRSPTAWWSTSRGT